MKYIALISLLFSFFSCDNNTSVFSKQHKLFSEFSVSENLSSDTLITDQYGLSDLAFIDKYLVLFSRNNNRENLFYIYDKNGNFLGSFGHIGRGPGEMFNNFYKDQYYLNNLSETVMWICDISSQKMHAVNIDQSLKTNSTCIEKTIKTLPLAPNTFYYNDTTLLSVQSSVENIYLKTYNPEVSETRSSDPLYLNDITNAMTCYNSIWGISPNKKWLVTGMPVFNQINFFNIPEKKKISTSVFRQSDLSRSIDSKTGLPFMDYYGDISCTDSLVFALYTGIPYDSVGSISGNPVTSVHIFNMVGNGLLELKLDKNIYAFTIDLDESSMLGLDYEDQIYKYDIHNVLETINHNQK